MLYAIAYPFKAILEEKDLTLKPEKLETYNALLSNISSQLCATPSPTPKTNNFYAHSQSAISDF
jgi:hypothetical protein